MHLKCLRFSLETLQKMHMVPVETLQIFFFPKYLLLEPLTQNVYRVYIFELHTIYHIFMQNLLKGHLLVNSIWPLSTRPYNMLMCIKIMKKLKQNKTNKAFIIIMRQKCRNIRQIQNDY